MKKKDLLIFELAKFMHETYEDKAKVYSWETQEITRVPFEKLPTPNIRTMVAVAKEIVDWFKKRETLLSKHTK